MLLTEVAQERRQEIPEDKWVSFIKEHCSDALAAPVTMFRGSDREYKVSVINPSIGSRSSKTGANHLMNWIEDDPTWEGYPSRYNSVFALSGYKGTDFGRNHYVVLPFNGSKIAICPGRDLNMAGAFPHARSKGIIEDRMMGENINRIRLCCWRAIRKATEQELDHPSGSYQTTRWLFEHASQLIKQGKITKEIWDEVFNKMYKKILGERLINKLFEADDIFLFMQDALSPSKNGYKVGNLSLLDSLKEGREVWTGNKVVVIDATLWQESLYDKLMEK